MSVKDLQRGSTRLSTSGIRNGRNRRSGRRGRRVAGVEGVKAVDRRGASSHDSSTLVPRTNNHIKGLQDGCSDLSLDDNIVRNTRKVVSNQQLTDFCIIVHAVSVDDNIQTELQGMGGSIRSRARSTQGPYNRTLGLAIDLSLSHWRLGLLLFCEVPFQPGPAALP